ncbi:MAG: hypothetical protein KDA90_06630 [Planctomycetaceae bacterium]|nr:hypothetical protein [Planctomycetaceae bacterium]
MAMMACRRPSLARQSQWLLGLLLLSGIVSFSGCTSLGLNLLTRKKPLLHADAKHPVMDVICLWEAAEGQNLDGLPCRGFAGQVLFFAHGHSEPVLVDGAVTVYVFDDQGDASEQSRPMHEFHFEGPAWNTYGRESSLGAAYQLFVPYTRPGSHHAACAIRVKYQPEGTERATFSKMANVILPGEKSDRADASMTRRRGSASALQQADAEIAAGMTAASGVVQASFEAAQPLSEKRSLETFSSALPSGAPRPDTSRLERILRQSAHTEPESEPPVASAKEEPATASDVFGGEVRQTEEPVTAPVEARRYRL